MNKINVIVILVFLSFCLNAQEEDSRRLAIIGNVRVIDKVHYEIGVQYNLFSKYSVALNFIPGFYRQHDLQGVYYRSVFRQKGIVGAEVFDPVYTSKFITIRPSFLIKKKIGSRISYNGIGLNWTRSNNNLGVNYSDPVLGDKNETFKSTVETFSLEFSHAQLFKLSSDWSLSGTFLFGTNIFEHFVSDKEQTLFVHQEVYHPGQGFLYRDFIYVNILIGVQWKLK